MVRFSANSVVFLGLGLISGSLALALRASGWQGSLSAWGPREPSLQRGQELGIIEGYTLDLDEAIQSADVIVIGAPPMASGDLLATVLPKLDARDQRPVVTDMASIKGWVIDRAGFNYSRFVPGHPIAGSEHSGVDSAQVRLFQGREVILTPNEDTDPQAIEVVSAMWQAAGSRITLMSVADHDAALAASSHSPHMIAYALTKALAVDPLDAMRHGGGALRDMTRIAGSDPLMWRDVALTNRAALIDALTRVEAEIACLKREIDAEDGSALEAYFTTCREFRRSHDAILNPLTDLSSVTDDSVS
jgi:prephenate dehydrogenase